MLADEIIDPEVQRDRVLVRFEVLLSSRAPCAGNASIPAERSKKDALDVRSSQAF